MKKVLSNAKKMASSKIFRHFLHASFFMSISLISNNIPTCEDIIFIHPCEDIVFDNVFVPLLKLNLLVYDRNIFGSPENFGNLRLSSVNFLNFRKMSGSFVSPSDTFWKIFGDLRFRKWPKTSLCNVRILYSKKKITWSVGDTKFLLFNFNKLKMR